MYQEDYPAKPEIPIARERSRTQLMFGAGFMVVTALFFLLDPGPSLWALLMIAVAFVVHELGHLIMLVAMRSSYTQVLNLPIIRLSGKNPFTQVKYWAALLSGPAFGLLIGMVMVAVGNYLSQDLLIMAGTCSVVFSFITLLPIDLSDGGNLLVDMFFKNNEQAKYIFAFVTSIAMIIVGIVQWWWPLILLGFFLIFRVKQVRQVRDMRTTLDEEGVDYHVTYDDLSDKGYWKIRDAYLEQVPALKEILPDSRSVWDNEHLLIRQVQNVLDPVFPPLATKAMRASFFILWLILLAASVVVLVQPWSNVFFDVIEGWR